ncbi:sigma-70 family RNA polymerase sigma factor [soil metagenome]
MPVRATRRDELFRDTHARAGTVAPVFVLGTYVKERTINAVKAQPMDVPEDLLDLYFSELGKVRLLTADDEVRLAKTIEAGRDAQQELEQGVTDDERRRGLERAVREGHAAFDHFVAANLRLVVSVAAQFSKRSTLDLGELIQEGNLGLLRAVEKFDWRRGFKFSTYATWWIRQAIQRGVAGSERTIRLPVALHDALVKVRAASARIEAETGREATIEELAAATRLAPDKVVRAMEGDHAMTSLDRPVGFDSDASDLAEFVAVAEDAPAEEVVERSFVQGVFEVAESRLDQRSWYVLQRRYGLDGRPALTLDALGKELGLSRESVRKIENQALTRLQSELGVVAA